MDQNSFVPPGRYRHYKGQDYTVLGSARHSETLEEFVLYRQEYGDHGVWVRPAQMFSETITLNGREVRRFQPLPPSTESEVQISGNLFQGLPQHLPHELVQTLIHSANVRIERIISHGHESPTGFWYDQPQQEWVIVLRGKARLRFETEVVELGPGDFIHIAAHRKHRVDWTAPAELTVWLAVHYT